MLASYLPSSGEEWKRWGLRALLFLAIVVVTWPVPGITAGPGLDPSWTLGLQMGVSQGLVWGRELIFTYGPLGISVYPIAIGGGSLLAALLLAGAVQLLLVGVLFVALRRQYGPIVSAILTFLVAGAVGAVQSDASLVAGFGISVLAVTAPREQARRAGLALAVGGGLIAALTMLIKLNDGIAVAAIVAAALAASPRPGRALVLALGTGIVALLAFWLLAGQPLFAIFDYLRNGKEIVAGYIEAMGIEEAGEAGEWQLLVLLGSAVSLTALAWTSFPSLSNRRLAALVAGILMMHYFILREVFIRHSITRGAYFVLLVPVALMIPWPRQRRGLALAIAAVLAVSFMATFPRGPERIWGPRTHAKLMAEQFHAALDGGKLDELVAEGRRVIKEEDKVPEKVLAPLRGRCVNAEPTEIAAIWAYELEWCPLPALQSYSAYTSRLDRLDAARYEDSENGPDGVLRSGYALDGRLPAWESPEAMLALLCNFTSAAESSEWQALVRVPDRCGVPRPAGSVRGHLGEAIEIPPAPSGDVLLAHIDGMQIGGLERLKMLFGRPTERDIRIEESRPYRVVPDTVGDGLIVSVPPAADFPPPFNLGVNASRLTPEVGAAGGPVTIELEAVPIEAEPGPPPARR